MKVILDNIIYAKVKNGGVSNYWFELSKHLMKSSNVDIQFFDEEANAANFHRNLLKIPIESIIEIEKKYNFISRLLPVTYNDIDRFIYHSSYYRSLSNAPQAIEVTTVYDFIHNIHSPFLNKVLHNHLKYSAINRSRGVICISKNTYADLKKYCPTKAHQKSEVIYVGVSDDYFPIDKSLEIANLYLQKLQIDPGFLLFIGGRTNYKNFDFVVEMLNKNKKLHLVIVGGGSLTAKEIKLFSKESLNRFHHIASATNAELNMLYNFALALAYPSSIEGFGIPVVEAMRAGCPVIGQDNLVIKEVAAKSALLLKKLDFQSFDKQLSCLFNNEFRQQIIQTGFEESKKFSWQKCCEETTAFYESIYDLNY